MSNEIRINYQEVYTKVTELRQRLTAELREMDATYRQAQMSLRRLDSRTNAEYIESIEANRIKAQVTAEALTKLLTFIEASTRQAERKEIEVTRAFNRSRAPIARRR